MGVEFIGMAVRRKSHLTAGARKEEGTAGKRGTVGRERGKVEEGEKG